MSVPGLGPSRTELTDSSPRFNKPRTAALPWTSESPHWHLINRWLVYSETRRGAKAISSVWRVSVWWNKHRTFPTLGAVFVVLSWKKNLFTEETKTPRRKCALSISHNESWKAKFNILFWLCVKMFILFQQCTHSTLANWQRCGCQLFDAGANIDSHKHVKVP